MKKYTRPTLEAVKFSIEDIITASGEVVNVDALTGKDKDMYEIYQKNSSVQNTDVAIFTW